MYGYEPAYSGKQMLRGDLTILFSKMSFLFRNRMMEVSLNHLLLQMESNSFRDSCMRFWRRDNNNNKLLKRLCWVLPKIQEWEHPPRLNKQEMPAELKVVSREHMCTYKQYIALKQEGEMIRKKWIDRTEVLRLPLVNWHVTSCTVCVSLCRFVATLL